MFEANDKNKIIFNQKLMIMKKSIFNLLFALICTMGFSQVSFNVKAGLNLSSYIGENSDHSEFKPGARIGVGMEYQF